MRCPTCSGSGEYEPSPPTYLAQHRPKNRLEDLADELVLTRERIIQIEKAAPRIMAMIRYYGLDIQEAYDALLAEHDEKQRKPEGAK